MSCRNNGLIVENMPTLDRASGVVLCHAVIDVLKTKFPVRRSL
ncbi:hypothetical protein NEIPOLOT_02178 [Neisseria polysaccharea ATCC 43768]|nr:hypothetical protein NEIPOLOT_02178 [Neisseria polysaccharea ATCC 43768]